MPSVAAKISAFASNITENVMFTTGQLLHLGNRNSIDIQLCRMVKSGVIKRLASGVFMKPSAKHAVPTAGEIAKIKAERFGKIIGDRLPAKATSKAVFYTNGCKSSFKSIQGRLYFKQRAIRNLKHNTAATPQNERIQSVLILESPKQPVLSKQINENNQIEHLQIEALELASRLAYLLNRILAIKKWTLQEQY